MERWAFGGKTSWMGCTHSPLGKFSLLNQPACKFLGGENKYKIPPEAPLSSYFPSLTSCTCDKMYAAMSLVDIQHKAERSWPGSQSSTHILQFRNHAV